jgi:putative sterol carrier protein
MAQFLTQAWLDGMLGADAAEAGDAADPSASTRRLQYIITGTPDGDVKYYVVAAGGRAREAQLGTTPEPDVTVTAGYDDWRSVELGELDPSIAFMQGVVKVSGDMAVFLPMLAATRSEASRGRRARAREVTEG